MPRRVSYLISRYPGNKVGHFFRNTDAFPPFMDWTHYHVSISTPGTRFQPENVPRRVPGYGREANRPEITPPTLPKPPYEHKANVPWMTPTKPPYKDSARTKKLHGIVALRIEREMADWGVAEP